MRTLPMPWPMDKPNEEMQREFDAHNCADHPKKQSREDTDSQSSK
jgi:hypothetical protein